MTPPSKLPGFSVNTTGTFNRITFAGPFITVDHAGAEVGGLRSALKHGGWLTQYVTMYHPLHAALEKHDPNTPHTHLLNVKLDAFGPGIFEQLCQRVPQKHIQTSFGDTGCQDIVDALTRHTSAIEHFNSSDLFFNLTYAFMAQWSNHSHGFFTNAYLYLHGISNLFQICFSQAPELPLKKGCNSLYSTTLLQVLLPIFLLGACSLIGSYSYRPKPSRHWNNRVEPK